MIERFKGNNGMRLLAELVADQGIVHGNKSIAVELVEASELQELAVNDVLIAQDSEDNAIFLIVSGSVAVKANGRLVATRHAGTHVGEMALINRKARRCATVMALEKSVVAKINEEDFSAIADRNPILWRLIAVELCDRLRDRNRMLRCPNELPNVFICSSSERLAIAEQIQLGLDRHRSSVSVWTDQVLGPMKHTMEDLEQELQSADFAIALISDEDIVESRKELSAAPRDNVVFELGLFMGQLGRTRSIIVSPRGIDLKLPSDLRGLTPLTFEPPRDPSDKRKLATALAPICTQLKALFDDLGPR